MAPEVDPILVLYDGVCALCNGIVRFTLARDRRDRFRFAPLQSELAAELLSRHDRDARALDTFYLVLAPGTDRERVMERGRAGLKLLRSLGGLWWLTAPLALLPTFLLDWGYNLVARNRYRRFGKYDACPVPAPEHRHKFVA